MRRPDPVVAFINVGHALDHMVMLIFPTAVLGMHGAFGDASYGELLALSIGGFIAFGAGSLPAGWLGDRWSRRNMMAVFFFGVGLATILTGLSASPAMLAVGLTLIGLFGAIYHPVGTAMLTAHVGTKVGHAIGVNGVWGNFGVAVAALAAGALTQWVSWRAAFIVPGALAILLGIAFLVLVPGEVRGVKKAAAPRAPLPRTVMVRAFASLALATIVGSVVFNASTVSLPKLFDERLTGLTATSFGIGALAFIVFMIGATAQIIVGRLVDRHPLRTVFVPLAALQAPFLLLAAFAQDWAMLVIAAGMMFAIFGQVTINDAMVAKYADESWRARAYALRYFMSFSGSATAVPLIALLHERTGGFTATFIALAVLGAIVFCAALLCPYRPEEVAPVRPQAQPAE